MNTNKVGKQIRRLILLWVGWGELCLPIRARAEDSPTAVNIDTRDTLIFNPRKSASRPFLDLALPVPDAITTAPALIDIGKLGKNRLRKKQFTPEAPLLLPTGDPNATDDYDEDDLDAAAKPTVAPEPKPVNTKPLAGPIVTLDSLSEKFVEVDAGNRVVLEAKPTIPTDRLRWFKDQEPLCEGSRCEFSTKDWGVGRHRITLLASNPNSSIQIFYDIKVAMLRLESDEKTITPLQIPYDKADLTLMASDGYVQAMEEGVFLHEETTSQAIGFLPQAQTWRGNLRTNSDGIATFGLPNREQHFVLPESSVQLVSEGKKHLLKLKKGRLRSRNFTGGIPRWTILAENWVQIDTDANGDVVVEYGRQSDGNDTVRISSLRGYTRVLYRHEPVPQRSPGEPPPLEEQRMRERRLVRSLDRGTLITMLPGTSLTLTKRTWTPPVLRTLAGNAMRDVLESTSPEYLDPDEWIKRNNRLAAGELDPSEDKLTTVIVMPKPKPDSEIVIPHAIKAVERHDPILALELLLPYAEEARRSFNLALLTGMAYRQLGQYEMAREYLLIASKEKPDASEPLFQRALVSMETGDWELAMALLWSIRKTDVREQEREYYLGVARFQVDKKMVADRNFTYSLWAEANPVLGRSARDFRILRDEEEYFILTYRGESYWTSNVFRQNPNATLPVGIPHRSSIGSTTMMEIKAKVVQDPAASLNLVYRFESRGWLYQELENLIWGRQTLAMELDGIMAQEGQYRTHSLHLEPFLQVNNLGPARIADGFGLITRWQNQLLSYEPLVQLETSQFFDPDPDRDDILDPFTAEIVAPSNRSARRLSLRLEGTGQRFSHQDWGWGFVVGRTRYGSSTASGDSFLDREALLRHQYRPAFRWTNNNRLEYRSRQYPDAVAPRQDQGVLLRSDLSWRIMPEVTGVIWLQYENVHSNIEDHTYDVQNIGGSFEISF